MVKTAPCELQISATRMDMRQEEGRSGGKIEWKLSEINTRAVSRGQNKLTDEFKGAAGHIIGFGGRL